ncbi:hypothetical protein ASPFODRAFT_128311 [Aspergillus luchuensis CBS 106.47]|uniref:Uncharacterized protein n=1 Tax=Aspergillus luchuensis (strain CBS 106.47) TaxID=1137211 RepID=A0A1M3TSW6_ASPLC|nr:hypothetical protein ASPFODRAFT_128311 [Aspergillus luchuensis CBS 106.47]
MRSRDNGPTDRNCGASAKLRISLTMNSNTYSTYPNNPSPDIPLHQAVVLDRNLEIGAGFRGVIRDSQANGKE